MENRTNVECWWKIGGSNLQAQYGYGTQAQADAFAARLNKGREINFYSATEVDDQDKIKSLDAGDEGFSFDGCSAV